MRFHYTVVDAWPQLAWLARCPRGGATVAVFHGPGVETADEWFCEAVWDGAFAAGDFDRTDLVFGSGARLRDEAVTFVSSGSTVDRLHSIDAGDALWVSNSLPCLLAAVNGAVDPTYPDHFPDFKSIIGGIRRYRRTLATSAGPVRLTYFENLAWAAGRLSDRLKPAPARDFTSFARYRAFLESSLARLAANMTAAGRRRPYEPLGTLSSGYDSPTVAVLARGAGLREAITFDCARGGEPDSGAAIAAILGVRLSVVPRDAWRAAELPEIPFIAADAKGEDVYFQGAARALAGRVLLTGFHGDVVWSKRPRSLRDDMVRKDQSGLSLTEYRLVIGFLHCPVPFMGARQIADINRLSRSPDMARWDVPTAYSRPICRRILEEAGVPRDAFGIRKRAASVLFFQADQFLSARSLADFQAWLEQHTGVWRRRGLTPPDGTGAASGRWQAPARAAARLLKRVAGVSPRGLRLVGSLGARIAVYGRWEPRFRYVFAWALDRARLRYAPPREARAPAAPRSPARVVDG